MVICLERSAELHMAQMMPLPLTVSCFSKIEIGFTFLVLAYPGSSGQRAVKRACVCILFEKYIRILALEMASARNQHGEIISARVLYSNSRETLSSGITYML